MEAETRSTPTTDDLVRDVREGVEKIAREALEEAAQIHAEADEKLARYDAASSELARLRLEHHALTHDLEELPGRLHVARLDGLVPDSHGENADSLQTRYIQARERLPVVEQRIVRLENALANLVAGGSRPAKVRNARMLLKYNARQPAMDALNEAAATLVALHASLPDVVEKAAEDFRRERFRVRDSQNVLWGQAKAPR